MLFSDMFSISFPAKDQALLFRHRRGSWSDQSPRRLAEAVIEVFTGVEIVDFERASHRTGNGGRSSSFLEPLTGGGEIEKGLLVSIVVSGPRSSRRR